MHQGYLFALRAGLPLRLRRACATAGALFVLGSIGLGGCSTDAVGIDACRLIQTARCEVAPACLGQEDFAIETEEQVENCITYYIDGCLVGVENPNAGDETGADCEAAVRELGKCATAKAATMAECTAVEVTVDSDLELTPCQVLGAPQHLKECAWLEKEEEEE